ncbi:MAG TPA: universal stress protein [Dehalococcoidia bacterium]|jgi:two-component system sensor histidine kinase KdpD
MDDRPDPDAVLAKVKRDERAASKRGSLRIYLGAFPGVGKTFAMLSEAQRRRSYGEDVVVGLVETHGRAATAAAVDGLEIVPRKRIEYKGVAVEEMDTEAILRRRPVVCLVDELAHTNAPGSEREKRYEDVEVIRDAGIHVVSTLNVQHLESLNDTVAALTGVRVRETIPDHVVDEADELILIDLSPEGARARMEHGHIYPTEQAHAALQNFFRVENLAQLREIALRRTAQEVDTQIDEYMRGITRAHVEFDEHVLVIVDASPFSRTLVRRGWRIAQGLKADLLVAYPRKALDEAARPDLVKTLELAEDLNGRIVPLDVTSDEEPAITALIRDQRVNHVVLAHHPRGALERMFKRSLADRLMRAVPHLDVHLVAGE